MLNRFSHTMRAIRDYLRAHSPIEDVHRFFWGSTPEQSEARAIANTLRRNIQAASADQVLSDEEKQLLLEVATAFNEQVPNKAVEKNTKILFEELIALILEDEKVTAYELELLLEMQKNLRIVDEKHEAQVNAIKALAEKH